MRVEIGCRELGGECDFVAGGESEEEILDCIMRHLQQEHEEDWFSVEVTYAAACELFRRKVA